MAGAEEPGLWFAESLYAHGRARLPSGYGKENLMRGNIIDGGKEAIVKTMCFVLVLAMFGVVGLASQASGATRPATYVALKAGIYSPSETFTFKQLNIETTFDGDTETGFNGEIAIGHYFLPTLALEAGAGYFKGKGNLMPTTSSTAKTGEVDFDVIPIIVSAKALIPVGAVDPYGEVGIGAYFTTVDVNVDLDGNSNNFSGSTSGTTTFGLHVGGGLNVNITPRVFVGLEGRYVWANPSLGDKKITLNATEYALNGFKLNGFTTTLGVGFGF